jgi:predicted RecB family nuclease
MKTKSYFLGLSFLFVNITGFSQFISDATTGKPYYQASDVNIEGTPLLTSWSKGVIKTVKNTVIENLFLNYDVYTKTVLFKINDSIYQFTEPVKEFVLENEKGEKVKFVKSGMVHNLLPGEFAEELVTGKMNLYKHYKKVIIEVADYNSVRGKKMYDNKNSFYTVIDNQLTLIPSLSKKQLEQIMGSKWRSVLAYMEQNKLSFKSQDGWIAAINHYNSLSL